MNDALLGTVEHSYECIACLSANCTESIEREEFPVGDAGVLAVAFVPVITCSACGLGVTDARAESVRHDAACAALGLLTSSDIKRIRAIYDMNRSDFASSFKVSRASLERWENRKLMISEQSNMYLRALEDRAVGDRLLSDASKRDLEMGSGNTGSNKENIIYVDFGALGKSRDRMTKALNRKQLFKLKRVTA